MPQFIAKMMSAKLSDKPFTEGATRSPERERSFVLSISTLVSGVDASGKEFQERTELTSISSQKATFKLDSGVIIGSRLNLTLDIPTTILLESQLRLNVSGDVCFAKAVRNGKKKQLIFLRLDKGYKIQPLS